MLAKNEYLLIVAMEEAAEVTHRASKVVRFGPYEIEPNTDNILNNAQRLRQEIIDFQATVEMLVTAGVIEPPTDRESFDAKKAKIRRFMEHSRNCGMLEPEHGPSR